MMSSCPQTSASAGHVQRPPASPQGMMPIAASATSTVNPVSCAPTRLAYQYLVLPTGRGAQHLWQHVRSKFPSHQQILCKAACVQCTEQMRAQGGHARVALEGSSVDCCTRVLSCWYPRWRAANNKHTTVWPNAPVAA
jgi:hypothetical protein